MQGCKEVFIGKPNDGMVTISAPVCGTFIDDAVICSELSDVLGVEVTSFAVYEYYDHYYFSVTMQGGERMIYCDGDRAELCVRLDGHKITEVYDNVPPQSIPLTPFYAEGVYVNGFEFLVGVKVEIKEF